MPVPSDSQADPHADPQTHLDTDPVNAAPNPEVDLGGDPVGGGDGAEPDATDDPAHSADEDEGWESEGGANPSGPATDS